MDENGQPVLQMRADENPVEVGLAPGNVLQSDAPPELSAPVACGAFAGGIEPPRFARDLRN